ncbi:HD domain-containing protein [bacterium]|nr:HD domain-containing protein [bacterium]
MTRKIRGAASLKKRADVRRAGGRSVGRKNAAGASLRLAGGNLLAENERLYTLLELSTLLSSVHDVDQLLKLLTLQTSILLGAARTSIFLYDEGKNEFWSKVAEGEGRKTIRVRADQGIVGLVFRRKKLINVEDAYRHPSFNQTVDRKTGFRTRNILACPMTLRSGGLLGVMEVLNKKSGSFMSQDEKMLPAIAAVAAVALENSLLLQDQATLFEAVIESSIHALGERDRITYGHTVRVAFYADRIARAVSAASRPPFKSIHYSPEDLRKLRFAALLHDIGKITVPEAILNKKDKLEPHEVENIRLRFEHVKLSEKIRVMSNGGGNTADHRRLCEGLDRDFDLVSRKIAPGPLTPGEVNDLDRLRRTTYRIEGRDMPLLTEQEHAHLALARGNLTEAEFGIMKAHVKKTWDILNKIYWPKDLREIPFWAATHHERPNGTGYPLGLKGAEIPLEGQILAVADIFDALTAADRPYKKRIPIDEAMDILRKTAEEGHVNKDIVDLFFEQNIADLTPPGMSEPATAASGKGV